MKDDCKIPTVGGSILGGEKVNERDYGEGIWLMDFIYLYEIEKRNLLQLL
jgi:hypothetical protein